MSASARAGAARARPSACPRPSAARSGRSRPRRTRTGGAPCRAAPRTSRTCCSRRTGSASGRRGRRATNGSITPAVELALEVHDVERDAELRRDAARVVGGVQRAAALLELGVASATSWRRIQTPTTSWPCSWSSAAATELVDAARHRDEDPAHRAATWPAGRRRPRLAPRAAGARTRGHDALRLVDLGVVVVRPRLTGGATPRASSSG